MAPDWLPSPQTQAPMAFVLALPFLLRWMADKRATAAQLHAMLRSTPAHRRQSLIDPAEYESRRGSIHHDLHVDEALLAQLRSHNSGLPTTLSAVRRLHRPAGFSDALAFGREVSWRVHPFGHGADRTAWQDRAHWWSLRRKNNCHGTSVQVRLCAR